MRDDGYVSSFIVGLQQFWRECLLGLGDNQDREHDFWPSKHDIPSA